MLKASAILRHVKICDGDLNVPVHGNRMELFSSTSENDRIIAHSHCLRQDCSIERER